VLSRLALVYGFAAVALLSPSAWAQDLLPPDDDYLPKTNSISVGGHVHTFGVGFDVEYRRRMRWNNRFEFVGTFSLSNFKDKEEARTPTTQFFNGGGEWVFDKKNWAYVMGFVGGMQYVLVPRSEFSRVEFKGGLSMGPTIVLLKPYYVQVATGVSGGFITTSDVPYDPFTPINVFPGPARPVDISDVIAEGSWFQGFDRITTRTGWRLRADFTLDLSGTSYFVRALNFGLQYDIYGSPLPLLATQPNQQNWFGGYLGVVLGNAW